ncbi:MAG TPA: AEC family transporter [Patescibacteria group bacterium]|nr:AEC family transporter [Patescibacteria group bacterium]
MVITGVILPVFFIIFLGFLLGRFGRVEAGVFSRTQLYILSPALVFMAMARTETETAIILKVFFYIVILVFLMLGVVQAIGLLLRGDRADRNAMSLAAVFMNSGFYGIPVCMLAFGEIGVVYATMFVACSSIVQATLGIFIASAGTRRAADALWTVARVPLIHAIILARILTHFSLLPPEPFMKMINMLGQAAIPIGLLLLGMQLDRVVAGLRAGRAAADGAAGATGRAAVGAGSADADPRVAEGALPRPLERIEIAGGLIAAFLRIFGGFAAALLILRFFDFDPMLRNVLIVESSMPTAVHAVVYATEFNCRPRLVTIGILTATLLSIVSITLILNYLA